MKQLKTITILAILLTLMLTQAGTVLAAPSLQEGFITGTITDLECGIDPENPTVLVTLNVEGVSQTVEIDLATAVSLEIIAPDTECSPDALADAIEAEVSIDPAKVILEAEVPQHPVGAALSVFFTDITDYETIMAAHEDGTGFGVLAQALWLTMKMDGNSDTFAAIVEAKKTKDFSAFFLEDGSIPQNWGQFKKAILNGDKKNNLGIVMSDKENKTNNGNGQDKDKTNNGNGQDKDKTNNGNKDKDKNN